MSTLVVYFSHAGQNYFPNGYRDLPIGNAEVIAKKVQALQGGDLFSIETVKTYPHDYDECCREAKIEQQNGELPALKNYLPSITIYDSIILVYPCWWGTMPQAVFTFLQHYDFTGKVIVPICTHEGSGLGRSADDLARIVPNAHLRAGLAIYGHDAVNCEQQLKTFFTKQGGTLK